jgi:hypothetical protein
MPHVMQPTGDSDAVLGGAAAPGSPGTGVGPAFVARASSSAR